MAEPDLVSERRWLSNDPKDPRWRFRVGLTRFGLIEILEEELTSANVAAQVTETTSKIILTPEQATWMASALLAVEREAT